MNKMKLSPPLYAFLYTATASANIIWPALFVAETLLTSLSAIALSLFIEAVFFHEFLKTITWPKALLMSCIGNVASTLVGTIVMTLILGFIPLPLNPSFVAIYLGSCLIEFLTIKLIFRYTFKQLWLPIFAGNFITYVLAFIILI